MDLGQVARRFPLVARPRPASTPLPDRVATVCGHAAAAERDTDQAAAQASASAVFNLAALLASDVGLPDLARQWCHRQANVYLRAHPLGAQAARHALEPLINLARLHMRAGDGERAHTLMESLFAAITERADTVVEGITLPAEHLTATPDDHQELRAWLWATLLATSARALAIAGRWSEAHDRLREHRGVGHRLFDGRQIAILAHATTGRQDTALALLAETAPGDPWENAVAAVLTIMCRGQATDTQADEALKLCDQIQTATGLDVFHTRLRLALIDALGEHERVPAVCQDVMIRTCTSGDGYAARDVLLHPVCRAALQPAQQRALTDRVDVAGLGRRSIPAALHADVLEALAIAETVLLRTLDETSVAPAENPIRPDGSCCR